MNSKKGIMGASKTAKTGPHPRSGSNGNFFIIGRQQECGIKLVGIGMKMFDQKNSNMVGGIKTSLSFFFDNAGSTRETPPAAADVFASLRSDEGTRREGSDILETAPWDLMGAFGKEAPGLSFGNLCTRISLRLHCRQVDMTLEGKKRYKTTIHTPTLLMEGIHENKVRIMKYHRRNWKKIKKRG